LTIRGGATAGAGLLKNGGPVTINRCVFENNAAWDGDGRGGAVYNAAGYGVNGGRLQITDSTFRNNGTQGDGGAILSAAGPEIVSGSHFVGNVAGGSAGALSTGGG